MKGKLLRFTTIVTLLAVVMLMGVGIVQAEEYRFVIVPKVVHPWFDKVNEGAKEMAQILEQETGDKFIIDYRAPSTASVVEQNRILEQAAATNPNGITLDLLDAEGNRPVLKAILDRGIPIVVFDSYPPEGMKLTTVQNDFVAQQIAACERLMEVMKEAKPGKEVYKVALIEGVPTAPNHKMRFETSKKFFQGRSDVEIVAEGVDNDSIEQAQKQAASIIAAHPDLDGIIAHNAAGPIGVGLAIKEAGKVGEIVHVGLDDLDQLLELIKEGVVDSSMSTKPKMQGAFATLCLWLQNLGVDTPEFVDTGFVHITKDMIPENVKEWKGF
ncbi:MAG: ribose transport system substrate-binding protein [Candidatus Atribacteria bacterium]|nr:ribose transport system substrate-binding protein [Candidatus Atribacteria bacterium]